MDEVLKKLKRGEIKIRKALNTHRQGERRSLFKGSGLEFDDVRPYQYGDDVRRIHWPLSSKGHGVYVKTFREAREQNIFFLVDVSASQKIGPTDKQKADLTRAACGTLILSTIDDANQVGLMLFTDRSEQLIRPRKGAAQAHKLLQALYHHQPQSRRTNITAALSQSLQLLTRTSILILISDFIDQGYTTLLKSAARRHDLILLHIQAQQEQQFPALGIVPFYEPERGQTRWLNTQSKRFKVQLQTQWQHRTHALEKLYLRHGADYVGLHTGEDYLRPLIKLFQTRNRRKHAR